MELKESDINVINRMLESLVEKENINISGFLEFSDMENLFKLKELLIANGHAKRNKCNKQAIHKTDDTDTALISNYYKDLYENNIKETDKKEKEYEKLILEINKIKRDRYISILAIAISIITLAITILKWLKESGIL